jgi:hypothetical protein
MMPKILFFILILPLTCFAQQDKFRFEIGLSNQTTINFGRTFEGVSAASLDYYPVYQTEVYTVTHDVLNFSSGLNLSFSINWLNNRKWKLEQSFSFYYEKYSEKLTFELTDIGNGDSSLNNHYNTKDIPLGYRSSASFIGTTAGTINDLTLLRKTKSGFSIGGGLSYFYTVRRDHPTGLAFNYTHYIPYGLPRQRAAYRTHQLGAVFQMEKSWGRFAGFLKMNQSVLTLKRNSDKGGLHFEDGYTIATVSQNLDYRFPLFIRVGVKMGIDRISKE